MKRFMRAALLLGLLTGLCTLSLAQVTKSSDEPPHPPPAASEYEKANWKEFSPPLGGYSVSMPGTPAPIKKKELTAIGPIPQDFYYLKTDACEYTVGYVDFMAGDSESVKFMLDRERKQILGENKNLKLLSEKDVTVEGSEGREWLIKDGDTVIKKKYFFSDKRYFQLTLVAPLNAAFNSGKPSSKASDFTDFYQMIVTRFFDSLKLAPIKQSNTGGTGVTGDGKGRIVRGGVINGKAISLPRPEYPSRAQTARIHGTVTVQVLIDEDGKVIEAKAISGHPYLREAAVEAAYRARFSATKIEGKPVKVSGMINYNF